MISRSDHTKHFKVDSYGRHKHDDCITPFIYRPVRNHRGTHDVIHHTRIMAENHDVTGVAEL